MTWICECGRENDNCMIACTWDGKPRALSHDWKDKRIAVLEYEIEADDRNAQLAIDTIDELSKRAESAEAERDRLLPMTDFLDYITLLPCPDDTPVASQLTPILKAGGIRAAQKVRADFRKLQLSKRRSVMEEPEFTNGAGDDTEWYEQRIVAMETDLERIKTKHKRVLEKWMGRAESAEAERDRLREALQNALDTMERAEILHHPMIDAALAAPASRGKANRRT